MSPSLQNQVNEYRQRRDGLATVVSAYQTWLARQDGVDDRENLRLYDLAESLKREQLVLAFVAEFSRGKSELINALFFADFGDRLLPSNAGRTTMCPTEIFHDPDAEPYLRLLPIETRLHDEGLRTLKRRPVEWSGVRLDLDQPTRIAEALAKLTEVKYVPKPEAAALGLWDEDDPALSSLVHPDGRVEVPVWRYALINFPHPLLKSGLVVLDTPGLNALGAEPELTLNIIPEAHAVVFLLAADAGLTRSDLEIWRRHVHRHAGRCLAVLNKADVLWDGLKTEAQVDAVVAEQVSTTARQLAMEPRDVFALSAQRALVAKIRGDDAMLRRSGIAALETALTERIIPARDHILRAAVESELGGMLAASQGRVRSRLDGVDRELAELGLLSGKNRGLVDKLRDQVFADKRAFEEAHKDFTRTRDLVSTQGRMLLAYLAEDRLARLLDYNRQQLQGTWTTAGLARAMQLLFQELNREFDKALQIGWHLKVALDEAYLRFHREHGFVKAAAPPLDLERHRKALQQLQARATEFCRDPVNLMTEKHFLIRKFYVALVAGANQDFGEVRNACKNWLHRALEPLALQLQEQKIARERRLENVRKIHENLGSLGERIRNLESQRQAAAAEEAFLNDLSRQLQAVQPPAARAAEEVV